MKDLGEIMKQANDLQAKMKQVQENLDKMDVEGVAGGGMVKITASVRGAVKGVKIDPSAVSPDDVEMLEDLILAAINDARNKADAVAGEEMKRMTGDLPLPPGLNFGF